MILKRVTATEYVTKEKRVFVLENAQSGKTVDTSKGGKLCYYLQFCFAPSSQCSYDVQAELSINGEDYELKKYHAKDGEIKSSLTKITDGKRQVVAYGKNCKTYLENLCNADVDKLIEQSYVNNITVESFHGDLLYFDEIKILKNVENDAESTATQTRQRKLNALQAVKQAEGSQTQADTAQIASVDSQLQQIDQSIATLLQEIGNLDAVGDVDKTRKNVEQQYCDTQKQLSELSAREEEIKALREDVQTKRLVPALVSKLNELDGISEQCTAYGKATAELATEIDWQEKQLADITAELTEKQRLYELSQDKRARIEAITKELNYIASLHEKNKLFAEQINLLDEQAERLEGEKQLLAEKLAVVENNIGNIADDLDSFALPSQSVSELLEAVRIDVKIDEVNTQLEKLQNELTIKESKIAEKENVFMAQTKRFKSVSELDVTISPLKAKNTILQVLEAKYNKLDTINYALTEKQRNLTRACEDYRYRIAQIEQSRAVLQSQLDRALLRKQEEFKREVYLNNQRSYDDVSGVYAVSVSFNDEEVSALRQQIEKRTADRDKLCMRVGEIEGALREIKRHVEINSAELETLTQEKNNINNRYNEIVAENKSEAVFHYLKALESNSGTKYLLDVQQEAVRSEAELAELKQSVESLKTRQSTLRSRVTYLKETQQQLSEQTVTADNIIETNDKLKNDLVLMGEKFTSNYQQYQLLARQLESTQSKLENVRAVTYEANKSVKVNKMQIAEATKRAEAQAGGENIEEALTSFKYEIGDVESDCQMLTESKRNIETELAKKRIELEKNQWLYDMKRADCKQLGEEIADDLAEIGLTPEQVRSVCCDDVEQKQRILDDYENKLTTLTEQLENCKTLLVALPESKQYSDKLFEEKQTRLATLQQQKANLEEQRKAITDSIVASGSSKAKFAAVLAEAETLSALQSTVGNSKIIALLVRDKIKSVLGFATTLLRLSTGTNYTLSQQDYVLSVKKGQESFAYDELDRATKTAVFVSLLLSIQHTDATDGRWILLEEKINADTDVLCKMFALSDDIYFVTNYQETI